MQAPVIAILASQAVFFAAWAFFSFRALFQIRAIAVADTGRMNPGPFSFLRAMGVWMRNPHHRRARLLWLFCLIGTMVPAILLAMRGAPVA